MGRVRRDWTERSLRALAAFGLTTGDLEDGPGLRARSARANLLAARIDRAIPPGGIVLITGPSGSGKSTVLDRMARRSRGDGETVVRIGARRLGTGARVIDLLEGVDMEQGLRRLASCGLGDARLAVTPARGLSEGERWRLAAALAIEACERRAGRVLLIADEFGSGLDDASARAVARAVRRLVAGSKRVRAAVAAPEGGAAWVGALRPGVRVRLAPGWIHAGRAERGAFERGTT